MPAYFSAKNAERRSVFCLVGAGGFVTTANASRLGQVVVCFHKIFILCNLPFGGLTTPSQTKKPTKRHLPQACISSATCCDLKLRQSRAWNPPQAAWNQHEVLYVINPKEGGTYTLTRDAIRPKGDSIQRASAPITYQSFGLDKKIQLLRVGFFWWERVDS